jgi:hypothetical protein
VLSGPAGELSHSDEVRRLYLGEDLEAGHEDPVAGRAVPQLARWTA